MLATLELHRYRGFERLKIQLQPHAYIVGPNSAGKSTVLEAIAVAISCLQRARVKNSNTFRTMRGGYMVTAHSLPPVQSGEDEDPVRYDFGQAEARLSLAWDNGARCHVVWPEDTEDEAQGFCYFELGDGSPAPVTQLKTAFHDVNVVPVVTPLERVEELKSASYVRQMSRTRLASRHFRNHAKHMQDAGNWQDFKDFVEPWLPEIQLLDVAFNAGANRLGVYYREPGSRVPKELAWAGDGIQIWVQLLWHVFRSRETQTILLDEPEVYLHPDLQRRLVRLLETAKVQVLMASHSADVIAEAPADGVVWVDRRLGRSQRAQSQQTLNALSAALGSSYNLALAKSMRSRLVLITDCAEPRALRALAQTVGAMRLAGEQSVSIVPVQPSGQWLGYSHLGQGLRELLPPGLPTLVLLGARSAMLLTDAQLAKQLSVPQADVLRWSQPSVENFLLVPEAIARASGAAPEVIALQLVNTAEELRDETLASLMSAAVQSQAADVPSTYDIDGIRLSFESRWSDRQNRLRMVDGRRLLQSLNVSLEQDGYRPATTAAVSRLIPAHLLDLEVFQVLHAVESRLD